MAHNKKAKKSILSDVDPLIRPAVKIMLQFGFHTTESCQGGEGHLPEPIVYFEGTEFDIIRATEICLAHNLNVLEGRRVYSKCTDVLKNNDYRNWKNSLGATYEPPINAIVFRMREGSIFCPS